MRNSSNTSKSTDKCWLRPRVSIAFSGQGILTVHHVRTLSCLPPARKARKTTEHVPLGAGNTGRKFDLETNPSVTEFKLIRWNVT